MRELKIGDVIELEEKHKDHIKAIKIKIEDSRCLMNTGAFLHREAQKELWDFIHSVLPEINGMNMNMNHEEHKINITGKF